MKKTFAILTAVLFIALTAIRCTKEKHTEGSKPMPYCMKGRLEIKGPCGQFVIKVLEKHIDTSKIETAWQDPLTGTSYSNVFTVENFCGFPSDIAEGDEFYFTWGGQGNEACTTCAAYRPTPNKIFRIIVSKEACPTTAAPGR